MPHSTTVLPRLVQSKLRYSLLKTGYVYDISMYFHQQLATLFDRDDPHPESPHRIYVIYKELKRDGYLDYCERINSRCATKEEVLRVHTEDHYNMMKSLQSMDEQALAALTDEFDSLYLNSESFHSALLSAGSVIEGCVAVVEGRVKNAFAIVRPPGHHAEQDEPMGFCLFNNVAISIKYLRDHFPEIKRILVLDWDIHFGNGTQRLTNDDKDVLYVSLHRYESQGESNEVVYFYPEDKFGSADYCGSGTGIGRTVNIPWTCDGVHDGDYLYAFQQVVMPVALEFEPSFVIVSAGFDAAAGDHIGQCCVTPAGYSQMTHMLKSLAGGKLLLALEGGYNLEAIAKSSAACMAVLMGEPPATPGISQPSEKCIRTIENVKRIQAEHWKCFQ
ncbi:hypothetical protein BX666DRAFT_2072215 [Dichotomocladium elegans]|nr:hypothetical protein BX666DRAFT_2072215 [Dichotomocladium elegans]